MPAKNHCRNCGTPMSDIDLYYCSPECEQEAKLNFIEEQKERHDKLMGRC